MMQQGEKVTRPEFTHSNYWVLDGDKITTDNGGHCSIQSIHNDWQLYEAPKPIVELLPHEFEQGQEVLVRDHFKRKWVKREFIFFAGNLKTHQYRIKTQEANLGDIGYRYCLPYAENAHLEEQITDGEHGAAPKGYVPPHVPKLGDETYWALNDEVIDLSRSEFYKIHCKTKNNECFYAKNKDGESIKFRYDGVI